MKRVFDTSVSVSEYNMQTHRFEETMTYRDAAIRQLDRHGLYPGPHLQLRVPSIDKETGEETDVDGDRSYKRFYLHGGELTLYDSESHTWRGYGEFEKYSAQFCLVEWYVFPYKWLVARERERAANARKGDELSDEALDLLRALVAKEEENRKNPRHHGSEFLSIPEGRVVRVGDFLIADDDERLLELRDKVGVGVYKRDREELVQVRNDEGRLTWEKLKTTGVIVHTEGRDIAAKYKR